MCNYALTLRLQVSTSSVDLTCLGREVLLTRILYYMIRSNFVSKADISSADPLDSRERGGRWAFRVSAAQCAFFQDEQGLLPTYG